MKVTKSIVTDLKHYADKEKAKFSQRFFKTGKGEYAEGDQFWGITVPTQRKIAKKFYAQAELADIVELLSSPIHEVRLTALFILVKKFDKAKDPETKQKIYETYLANTKYVNNWDLVDSSAHKIVGAWLFDKDRTKLYELAKSKDLWEQRIAMMATMYFVKNGDLDDTYQIAKMLLNHPHDLIHKSVGWLLREAGKKDQPRLEKFLKKHLKHMPRTMLRYAIEKFSADLRRKFLKSK